MSCAQANVTTSLLTDYTHCENFWDTSHSAFCSVSLGPNDDLYILDLVHMLTLKHSLAGFVRKTLKSVYVEAKVSGQWKRNIFLAAGFYGAEAGGNIESAAAADSHTTAHVPTHCS